MVVLLGAPYCVCVRACVCVGAARRGAAAVLIAVLHVAMGSMGGGLTPPGAGRPCEVGIVGGGLGGLALARALQLSSGFRVTVFERDTSFEFRNQGYAITIQQGGRALAKIGLLDKVVRVFALVCLLSSVGPSLIALSQCRCVPRMWNAPPTTL